MPSLKKENKLPVVLSPQECKLLFKSGRILKHRVLLSFIYSAGLRLKEVRNLKLSDVDFDRMMIHIRQTKYNKDRYVPLSPLIKEGLKKYIDAYNPKVYLFNGKSIGSQLSDRGSGIIGYCIVRDYKTIWLEKGLDVDQCPNCKKGRLILIGELEPQRGPPNTFVNYANRHFK